MDKVSPTEKKIILDECNEQQANFISRVIHEFRTPLHAIIGFTKHLLQDSSGHLTEEDHLCLKKIYDNSIYMLDIANSFLEVAGLDWDVKIPLEMSVISLHDLILEITEMLEGIILEQHLHLVLVVDVPKDLKPFRTHPELLKHILVNLIYNAIKFIDGKAGQVKILVTMDPVTKQATAIHVTDTGCGIPEEKLSHIFEPLIKLNNRHRGAGIGLSIVKKLYESMGYGMEVQSEVGKGSAFTLIIPQTIPEPFEVK